MQGACSLRSVRCFAKFPQVFQACRMAYPSILIQAYQIKEIQKGNERAMCLLVKPSGFTEAPANVDQESVDERRAIRTQGRE